MKNVIYVFALLLITCCSCSSKGQYTKIMNEFVELNKAMGVAKEDVGVIIANVRNTISTGKKSTTSFFRTLETQCASALAKINSSIHGLTQALTDATNQINNWKKNLGAAQADVKDATRNIEAARKQRKALKARMNKFVMDYRVYATEADKKLTVVKVLRDIITDELYNRAPGALVQVKKFNEKLVELKNLLNNNSDSLYSPMISVLLDLATEQNFSDQSVLKKILENLKNLDKALRDFRTKQEASLNAETKSIRKQIRNVRDRLRAYRRMRRQATSKAIDANNYIKFYQHEVEHFTAEKGRQTDELNLFKKLCAFEKKVHASAVASFRKFKTKVVPYLFSAVQQLK